MADNSGRWMLLVSLWGIVFSIALANIADAIRSCR